jgi:hypothetical protein
MSKDIRKMIDKVKNFKRFMNENINVNKTIDEYLNDVEYGDYDELTTELYDFISMEGWLVSIEEEFDEEYNQEDFEYLILNISEQDKIGLMKMDEQTVEKFSEFDLKLKERGEYPYDTLDFIDYDKGIVYIIRLI